MKQMKTYVFVLYMIAACLVCGLTLVGIYAFERYVLGDPLIVSLSYSFCVGIVVLSALIAGIGSRTGDDT